MVKTKRILTRAEEEDKKRLQLEKDAKRKRLERSKHTETEKKSESAKRLARYHRQKQTEADEVSKSKSISAKSRKQKSRAKSVGVPKTPRSTAKFIEDIVESATPNTSTALKKHNICDRRTRAAICSDCGSHMNSCE